MNEKETLKIPVKPGTNLAALLSLLSTADHPLAPAEIAQAVWQPDRRAKIVDHDRLIRVLIHNLRRKGWPIRRRHRGYYLPLPGAAPAPAISNAEAANG